MLSTLSNEESHSCNFSFISRLISDDETNDVFSEAHTIEIYLLNSSFRKSISSLSDET